MTPAWLTVERGAAPLLVSLPHTGTELPDELAGRFVSPALARHDADWHVERLYGFARALGATIVRTALSRSVIDVNRDPSGASLYPGQATTGLCPTETFDGVPLYPPGAAPDGDEIARRRERYFAPYHRALVEELARLRGRHPRVVLYDAHSIRSVVPRLFDGILPHINIGTNGGASCRPALARRIEALCAASEFSWVTDGRFKGGWITRHYGAPTSGIDAVQIELACRAYLAEPDGPVTPDSWPPPWDPARAAPLQALLRRILESLGSEA